MRTGVVVRADILRDEVAKMLIAEDQDIVEELATERADEALCERVHVWGAWRRPDHAGADGLEHQGEARAELGVAIADEHLRRVVHRRVSSLLRAPCIGRCACHGSVHNRAGSRRSRKKSTKTSRNRTS